MNAILSWISGARWRESFSHCFEGLLIFFPAAGALLNWWGAAFCVVVWYWSSKRMESETPGDHVGSWTSGWFPWQWTAAQRLDVVFPAVSSYLLAWALATYAQI